MTDTKIALHAAINVRSKVAGCHPACRWNRQLQNFTNRRLKRLRRCCARLNLAYARIRVIIFDAMLGASRQV